MKFFTPDLFLRFNSPDDEDADRADEEWESAIRGYRTHLDGLREQMPSQVQKLAGLCLHDSEILASEQRIEPFLLPAPSEPFPIWAGFSIMSVRRDLEVVSLIYVLWDRVRTSPPPDDWPFSTMRLHWLYDEVDLAPNPRGMFLHRVLLSDGSIMEIPFLSALIHSVPLGGTPEGDASKRIA